MKRVLLFYFLERAVERDYFMTAEEAKEFGLIDRVLEKREIKPSEPTI